MSKLTGYSAEQVQDLRRRLAKVEAERDALQAIADAASEALDPTSLPECRREAIANLKSELAMFAAQVSK